MRTYKQQKRTRAAGVHPETPASPASIPAPPQELHPAVPVPPAPPTSTSRWLLDIPEACRELHVSRAQLFRLLASGELGPSCKIGRRRLIPVSAIEAFIARCVEDGGAA